MSTLWRGFLRWRWQAAGLGLVAAFAVLAGRFWHPYYGFTKFVQFDEYDARSGISEVRAQRIFVYPGFSGYDGGAYTQLAFHPLLDSPELERAIDNLPYRARRILGSALAWMLAGGDPARIATTYAGLNLAVWLVLAAVLWRVLPVTGERSWVAWAGVMLSAGVLHSVRLALTDLLATTLFVTALWLGERGLAKTALGILAISGLARETALAGVVGLWRGPWNSPRSWLGNGLRSVVVALPLLAWTVYVRLKTGATDQGLGNFTWPLVAWLEKWGETVVDYVRHPEFSWLITTTLLATVALTVQAAYLIRRPQWCDGWWRAGAGGVVMMALLGTAVWEGHPGAATRVLLPMSVAFAVLAVRARAGWGWIAAGSLSVFSGVLVLWEVPNDPREIAAGRSAVGAYIVQVQSGWHGVERRGRAAWSWAETRGEIVITPAQRGAAARQVRLRVRAITPREIEVRDGEHVLWHGGVGLQPEWIEVSAPPREDGRFQLELRTAAAPQREHSRPGARALGFALSGVEVR